MRTNDVCLEVYGRTDIGKVRQHNEDAFVIADLMASCPIHAMPQPIDLAVGPQGVLLAVSDGMGGAQASAVARAFALQALRRGVNTAEASTAETALTASVRHSERKVWDVAVGSGRDSDGPTIAVVLIQGNRAFIAEIGDSHAYVLRGSSLVRLTRDQNCGELHMDEGGLSRESVETLPYNNVILQAIGTRASVIVTLNRLSLRQGDRLLLCSDGLSKKLKEGELRAIVTSTPILDVACRQLVELANARGGEDNITVVLAEMRGDGLPALLHEPTSSHSSS
jgi:serine/threonine protein phosphatase PrpC